MQPLKLLAALVLLTSCAAAVSDRPCPRVTPFSEALQTRAADELATLPPGSAVGTILDATAADRAFNRAVCL